MPPARSRVIPLTTEGPPARILATDDRPEVLRLVERTLGERYECELAGDVEEARERLAAGKFALALCDIQMPGESGLLLVEEIARKYPEMAIVLVTGVDDAGVAERAFELGAHGYLVKPFWPGQLLITTMNALRQSELELAQQAHSTALENRLQTLMDKAPVPIYVTYLTARPASGGEIVFLDDPYGRDGGIRLAAAD